MIMREFPKMWSCLRVAFCVILGLFGATASSRAGVTNAIWEARFGGSLVIQRFMQDVTPRTDVAKFKKGAFLGFVLNSSPSASQKLGFNIDMIGGRTNFYLTVFDQSSRRNTLRVTRNEQTIVLTDGSRLYFSLDAELIPYSPQWGGGYIRIVGRARMVNGVPAGLRGKVTGAFVDNRPGDLNGTTGLVTRATISTRGAPLRIQPVN
jgi:hypothetical protein